MLYTNLNLRLNRVDGAIVWLNGREIFRTNLPSGPISFLTQATTAVVGDAMSTYFPANVPIACLPAGTNVVAVEVHRFSPSQASLSFDLELFGAGAFAPRLAASRDGADFTVRWPATNNAGFILLSGTNLSRSAAWSPLGGPYLLNGGFYEYREPLIQSRAANFYQAAVRRRACHRPEAGLCPGVQCLGPLLADQLRRLQPRDLHRPAARRRLADRRRTLSAQQRLFRAVGPDHQRPSAVLSPSQAPAVTSALRAFIPALREACEALLARAPFLFDPVPFDFDLVLTFLFMPNVLRAAPRERAEGSSLNRGSDKRTSRFSHLRLSASIAGESCLSKRRLAMVNTSGSFVK